MQELSLVEITPGDVSRYMANLCSARAESLSSQVCWTSVSDTSIVGQKARSAENGWGGLEEGPAGGNRGGCAAHRGKQQGLGAAGKPTTSINAGSE